MCKLCSRLCSRFVVDYAVDYVVDYVVEICDIFGGKREKRFMGQNAGCDRPASPIL